MSSGSNQLKMTELLRLPADATQMFWWNKQLQQTRSKASG